MNEDILGYLDSLTLEQVSVIEKSINRDALPKAKAFWRQVKDAKRTGWDESLSSVFANRAGKLGLNEVFRGYEFPKSIQDIAEGKAPSSQPASSGLVQRPVTVDDLRSNVAEQGFKPADFAAGSRNIPTPSQLETSPAISPSVASNTSGGTNVSQTRDRGSNTPQNASRKRSESIVTPERESPFGDLDFKELESLKSLGFESLNKQVEEYEMRVKNTPSTDLARRENIQAFLGQARGVLGPLVDTIDFIEQRRQTKQAERVADRSMRQAPNPPMVRGENRILSNLIRDSQVAYSNPAQMIQPYMDQTNLGYQQDLSQAQELSGGQAGNMMGLSQAAAIRRNQSNLGVAPMSSQIYQQGLETTGALVGQQMQDDAWRDQQTISLYDTANRNNQEFQRQAGLGLAMSRARQIQARNNMLDGLLQSPAFDVDTYMNYTRNNLTNPPTI